MAGSTFVAYHICVSIFLALIPKMAPIPKKTIEIAIGITPIGNIDRGSKFQNAEFVCRNHSNHAQNNQGHKQLRITSTWGVTTKISSRKAKDQELVDLSW